MTAPEIDTQVGQWVAWGMSNRLRNYLFARRVFILACRNRYACI